MSNYSEYKAIEYALTHDISLAGGVDRFHAWLDAHDAQIRSWVAQDVISHAERYLVEVDTEPEQR